MKLGFGSGKLILSHSLGWACSKEAEIDFEVDILPGGTARKSIVISFKGLFDVVGECIKGTQISGIFKYDSGTKVAFNGILEGAKRIKVIGQTNNDFETVFNKISQWQSQYS